MYEILHGNAMELSDQLPSQSVQTIVTSPPYFGLRDYKVDGQFGLEKSPQDYVNNLVELFRKLRRVLKDDGTVWLNLGDSYGHGTTSPGMRNKRDGYDIGKAAISTTDNQRNGLKAKDLIGIPWRVAFALQDDGWILRSDIIWAKPNPMPESVTDRPTKSHEYIFLLSKQPRYFYDHVAVREDGTQSVNSGWAKQRDNGINTHKYITGENIYEFGLRQHGLKECNPLLTNGRNRRTIWTVSTQPYKGAHFATYPKKLIEPCILAGTSEAGQCPHCGKAWARVVERKAATANPSKNGNNYTKNCTMRNDGDRGVGHWIDMQVTTLGFTPQCQCPEHKPVPQTVLDPFCGSGTTLAVANIHGRRGIGFELNADYIALAHERIASEVAKAKQGKHKPKVKTKSTDLTLF